MKAKPRASEQQEQAALMSWASLSVGRWPELALLYHVPNGGHRHPAVAAGLRRQGVKPGVPDLHLPVSRGGHHGLWIELKAKGGRVSPVQAQWIAWLREQGHHVCLCVGWEAARDVIIDYLNGEKWISEITQVR